jgi:hypothetical protein
MRNLICGFWRDESGSVVVGEWVFVATILVLGAVAGMVVLHHPRFDDVDSTPTAAATMQTSTAPASVTDGR